MYEYIMRMDSLIGLAVSGTTAALIGFMALASAGSTMYSSRQSRKAAEANRPQPMVMPATPKAIDAAAQARQTMRGKKIAMGRSRSIYTSPLGLGGEANIIKKKLLGQ